MKKSIRFGVKGTGWFPNAGVFVAKFNDSTATIIIDAFNKLAIALRAAGENEWADRIVAEYR